MSNNRPRASSILASVSYVPAAISRRTRSTRSWRILPWVRSVRVTREVEPVPASTCRRRSARGCAVRFRRQGSRRRPSRNIYVSLPWIAPTCPRGSGGPISGNSNSGSGLSQRFRLRTMSFRERFHQSLSLYRRGPAFSLSTRPYFAQAQPATGLIEGRVPIIFGRRVPLVL